MNTDELKKHMEFLRKYMEDHPDEFEDVFAQQSHFYKAFRGRASENIRQGDPVYYETDPRGSLESRWELGLIVLKKWFHFLSNDAVECLRVRFLSGCSERELRNTLMRLCQDAKI